MVKVEGRRIIRASVQKVFQLVSRLDASPRVTGLWLTADLVERKSNGLTVQYRGYFAGMPVESIQRAIFHPPNRIEFRQTRGGLKSFRGTYQFKPVEGDTEVSLMLEAEAGIPLLSETATRLVLHSFIERSLEKFKLTAERDLPRVVRKAANGAAAKEAGPAEPEEAAPPTEVGEATEREAPEPAAAKDGEVARTGPPPAQPSGAQPGTQPPGTQARGPQPPGMQQPGTRPPGRGKKRRRRRGRRRGGGRGPRGPASGSEPGRGGSGSGSSPG